jgi:hypothetical protein
MRRLELLIEEARSLSQNERYDADSGLSQNVFVRFFKNAQDKIVREIVNTKSKYLLKEKIVDTVNAQEVYSLPEDLYLHNIDTLEYSQAGTLQEYVTLTKCYTKDRMSNETGFAFGYMTRENELLLVPPVQGGGRLRVNYIRNPNKPQKRCGFISATTTSGATITGVTLDIAEASFDLSSINKENFFCIVSRDGVLKVANIEYNSINPATGVFTLTNPAPYNAVLSSTDYIVVGKNSTNQPELPDICESYLILHASYEAKYGDSSNWSKELQNDMKAHLGQLISSFAKNSDDITEVNITNVDYLSLF